MDMLKAYFPFSFDTKDVKTMIIKIVIYVVLTLLVALVCRVIGFIPFVGPVLGWLIGSAVGAYATAGIVFTVLNFCKVMK